MYSCRYCLFNNTKTITITITTYNKYTVDTIYIVNLIPIQLGHTLGQSIFRRNVCNRYPFDKIFLIFPRLFSISSKEEHSFSKKNSIRFALRIEKYSLTNSGI